jgi:hypothetical protein
MVGARAKSRAGADSGAAAEIFDKLEPHKNRPAPQNYFVSILEVQSACTVYIQFTVRTVVKMGGVI